MPISTPVLSTSTANTATTPRLTPLQQATLRQGEILVQSRSYSAWGGALDSWLYLPLPPDRTWQQLTHYDRWTEYFPNVTHSQVLSSRTLYPGLTEKRLYQMGCKTFLFLTAQVEAYLQVREDCQTPTQRTIAFTLERGSFQTFSAQLALSPFDRGTVLSYSVQAVPAIPVPSLLIEQAMLLDFPSNLRQMRRVLTTHS